MPPGFCEICEPIAKLCGNVAQSPSAVFNLLYFQCFLHDLPSRGRLGYSFAIGSCVIFYQSTSQPINQLPAFLWLTVAGDVITFPAEE